MEAFVEKEKRSYVVYIKHHNQTFYMQYRSKEKERSEWYCDMLNKMLYDNLTENNSYMQMYSVLKELQESACYWSEYNVPLGIVDRINDVLKKVENNKKPDAIKTTFDLRTCFTNMQDEDGWIILDKTQLEEILKQVEK